LSSLEPANVHVMALNVDAAWTDADRHNTTARRAMRRERVGMIVTSSTDTSVTDIEHTVPPGRAQERSGASTSSASSATTAWRPVRATGNRRHRPIG